MQLKILDGFSARNVSDTNIDLPPHPDYGWLPEFRLTVLLLSNFPSQFEIIIIISYYYYYYYYYNIYNLLHLFSHFVMF